MTISSYIIEMPRFRKLAAKPKFLARFYSPQEMKFLMEKHFPVYTIAEMMAAKAAFVKTMGVSASAIRINEISVLTDYSGAYYISLSGKAKKLFAIKKSKIAVSCTHTKGLAQATVLLYD